MTINRVFLALDEEEETPASPIQLPDITPKWRYDPYWSPVRAGTAEPDQWQQALMDQIQAALDAGLRYTTDVNAYVKAHATFIPAEWWDYQYSGTKVEGGIMGMECYCARDALSKQKERAENQEAVKLYHVGQKIGTLYIQGKRVTGLTIDSIEGTTIWMTSQHQGYTVKVWAAARAMAECKRRAIERGWCKS